MQEIPERLMSVVLHALEARLRSAAWNERAMPEMSPARLAPDSTQQDEQIKCMEDLWRASGLGGERTGHRLWVSGGPIANLFARLARLGKACVACLTRGNHKVEQCPLLVAIAVGSEEDIKTASAFCNKLSRMKI